MRVRRTPIALLALAGAMVPVAASAESVNDKFWLRGAAFFASVDTKARFDVGGRLGTDIDFEDTLGLKDNQTLPQIKVGTRFGSNGNWHAEFEYFRLSRTNAITLARTIVWEDTTYEVGALVNTKVTTNFYVGSLGYAFVKKPDLELGANIGLFAGDFTFGIAGVGLVNGIPVTGLAEEEKKQLVPLPTVGLYLNWNIAPQVILSADADYFTIKVGDYKGSLVDLQAGVQYRVIRNLGIGAAYRYTKYELRASADDWTGRVDYDFHGPVLFVELAF